MTTWRREGDQLTRSFEFPSFMQAMAFVNQVASVAEEIDHHPDIMISWRRVTLNLSSHDTGGITRRDFALAERIDSLITETGGQVIS